MYELLSKKAQDYVSKYAHSREKTIASAMQDALIKEVIKSIETGELTSRSDFGFRRI